MLEQQRLVRDVLAHSCTTGPARSLMAAFALHADLDTLESRPGLALLGDHAGRTPRQVERILPAIVELGELERVRPGGGRVAATFRILVGSRARLLTTSHAGNGEAATTSDVEGASTSPLTSRGSIATVSCGAMSSEQNVGTTTSPYPLSANGNGKPVDAAALFAAMRDRLAAEVGSRYIAHTMVDPLELLARRGNVLEVLAPDHSELRIRRTYGPRLEAFARELSGEKLRVHIVTERMLEAHDRRAVRA